MAEYVAQAMEEAGRPFKDNLRNGVIDAKAHKERVVAARELAIAQWRFDDHPEEQSGA